MILVPSAMEHLQGTRALTTLYFHNNQTPDLLPSSASILIFVGHPCQLTFFMADLTDTRRHSKLPLLPVTLRFFLDFNQRDLVNEETNMTLHSSYQLQEQSTPELTDSPQNNLSQQTNKNSSELMKITTLTLAAWQSISISSIEK